MDNIEADPNMSILRDEPIAGNEYCSFLVRIFNPHKICLNPHVSSVHTSTPSSTRTAASTYTAPSNDDESREIAGNVFLLTGLGVLLAAFVVALLCSLSKICKRNASLQEEARTAHSEQPPPILRSRLSTWWNRSKSGGREGRRDVEMGRIKRSLSRVRSIAKPTPLEIQVPVGVQQRVARNSNAPRLSRTARRARNTPVPSANPPSYDNISRGSQIAGAEERVATPPPTYHQRTGDRDFWEDDRTSAPGYS